MANGPAHLQPLSTRLSDIAPRAAQIVKRGAASAAITPTYDLKVGDVLIPDVGLDEIHDFVSPRDLEVFENAAFRFEIETRDACLLAQSLAQQSLKRKRRLQDLAHTSESSDEFSGADRPVRRRPGRPPATTKTRASSDSGEIASPRKVVEVPVGKHGRPRPSYRHLYLRGSRKGMGNVHETGQRFVGTGAPRTGARLPPVKWQDGSDADQEESDAPARLSQASFSRGLGTGSNSESEGLPDDVTVTGLPSIAVVIKSPPRHELAAHTPISLTQPPPDAGLSSDEESTVAIRISEPRLVNLFTIAQNPKPRSSSMSSGDYTSARSSMSPVPPAMQLDPHDVSEDSDVIPSKVPTLTRAPNAASSQPTGPGLANDATAAASLPPAYAGSTSSSEVSTSSEEGEYEVERILTHHLSDPSTHPEGWSKKPVMLYQVKWVGFDVPTWEPASSFAAGVVDGYWAEAHGVSKSAEPRIETEETVLRPDVGEEVSVPKHQATPATTTEATAATAPVKPAQTTPKPPPTKPGPGRSRGRPRKNQELHDGPTYEVEAIRAHQLSDPVTHPKRYGTKPVMLYHVKWTGYDDMTWEPIQSFEDTSIVEEYKRRVQAGKGK